MKRYVIIDTRSFDVQCVTVEAHGNGIIFKECRQYLPPSSESVWRKKLPRVLDLIQQNIDKQPVVFLLPEAACMNLTVEIPQKNGFSVDQRIEYVLYKDFGIYPSKMIFQSLNLDKNRYLVTLISKHFFSFIKAALRKRFADDVKIFPPVIGQLAYAETLKTEGNTLIVFAENNLRRFFIQTQAETNFIDLYHSAVDQNENCQSIRNAQKFIYRTLDLPEGESRLFFIGNALDELAELYAAEYGLQAERPVFVDKVLGSVDKITDIKKCIYCGINDIVEGKNERLNDFNFYAVPDASSVFLRKIFRHKSVIYAGLFIWAVWALGFSGFVGMRYKRLHHVTMMMQEKQNHIRELQRENKLFKKWYNQRTVLPKILVNYCYLLQTMPGDFCLDHMGFVSEGARDYCSIRGRVYHNGMKRFKQTFKLKLHHKIEWYSEPSFEDVESFSVRIPLKVKLPSL